MVKSSVKSCEDDKSRPPDENPLMALVDAATSLIDPDTQTDNNKALSCSKNVLTKKMSFAEHLMSVLDDSANSEYLAWMPDGKAFSIVDPKKFLHNAMARLFNIRNMSSFVRKLGRWGFRRVHEKQTRNSDIFTHPDFRRGDYQRCRNIRPVGKKTAPVLPFTPPVQHATKQKPSLQYSPTASSLYDATDRRRAHPLPYSSGLPCDHISSKIASDVVHAALETLRLDELCAQQSAFLKAGPLTSQGRTVPRPVASATLPPSADLLYHQRSWLHNAGDFR